MSGSHRSGSHRAGGSGGYGSDSGGYRTGSGGYRAGSGGYRTGSGSHRVVHNRPQRWRLAGVLAGVACGVVACATAAFVVLNSVNDSGDETGGVSGTGQSGESPLTGTERQVVPDACGLVSAALAQRLAPNADRTQADNYQASDRQNQCVWGAYTGDRKRQLTVELRAVPAGGQSATDSARTSFQTEKKDDQSGKGLLPSQKLTVRRDVPQLGQEAYVVYSEDGRQGSGEAIVNARISNVLITVHYSGGNGDDPLGSDPAIGGGIEAAKEVAKALSTST